MLPLHEPDTPVVDEESAFSAHGLGDERLLPGGVGAEPHHGRVELHELQVAEHCSGSQGERHPVAGRDRRVGGGGVDLPEPARGEHHCTAVDRAHSVALTLTHHVQRHASDPTALAGDQVEDQGVLDDLDVRGGMHRGDERALDLGAGGIPTGVRDPVAVVPALPGQGQLTGVGLVEDGAELDQATDCVGTLRDEGADRVLVAQAGAGDQGVVKVLVGGVSGPEGGGDPALRPLGRPGGEDVLGHHHHRAHLPGL